MKIPAFLTSLSASITRKQLVIGGSVIIVAILLMLYCSRAHAGDTAMTCAPGCIKTPKPLTCDQLVDRMVTRHCVPVAAPVVPCCVTGETGAIGPAGPKGDKGDSGAFVVIPPPVVPLALHVRALLGGGVDYTGEHNLGGHLFTGVQFPASRDDHIWQLQFGPSYMRHDDVDVTCRIGCRSCPSHVKGAGPWGGTVSAVIVF